MSELVHEAAARGASVTARGWWVAPHPGGVQGGRRRPRHALASVVRAARRRGRRPPRAELPAL